jgi:hypothetical protein
MVIDLATASYLIREVQQGRIRGRALTFGKADPVFTFDQLLCCMAACGALVIRNGTALITERQNAITERYRANGRAVSHKPAYAQHQYISDEFFYAFIGLSETRSVDHCMFADADYAFDFNTVGLRALVGTFDVIFDGGLLGSVFHVPNFLQNVFEVLEIGGIVVHRAAQDAGASPAFYTVSPRFFHDYYGINGYAEVEVSIWHSVGERTEVRPYPSLDAQGISESSAPTVQCSARKTASASWNRVPFTTAGGTGNLPLQTESGVTRS